MKRLILILATTLSVYGGMAAGEAQAAATCTIHGTAIFAWSEQNDWISYNADFKCGGAENTRFKVKITLQEDIGGWLEPGCDAGPCITYRPSATTWFPEGTEHYWTGTFHPAADIDGQDFRIRADIIFANGDPTIQYFSTRTRV